MILWYMWEFNKIIAAASDGTVFLDTKMAEVTTNNRKYN